MDIPVYLLLYVDTELSLSPEDGTQLDRMLLGKRSAKNNITSQERSKVNNKREAEKKKE
jgi:hypothetical protein